MWGAIKLALQLLITVGLLQERVSTPLRIFTHKIMGPVYL
jgi:hypothetical protein